MSVPTHWFARAWHSVWGTLHGDADVTLLRQKTRLLSNPGDGLLLVVTEPEGQDFWLRPGETIELRAEIGSDADDFELTEDDGEVTVWPSAGMGYISVWCRGEMLNCGYQRPTE